MAVTVGGTSITFNDGTTQTTAAGGAPTTAQVLSAYGGASFGAVGTYAVLSVTSTSAYVNSNGTASGSILRYDTNTGYGIAGGTGTSYSTSYTAFGGTAPSGTWKKMGGASVGYYDGDVYLFATALWLRIA